jgi:2-polyprenyl-3-methyl-5-hydroxy-6-metoxy-1,4-benzoquinol methylase
VITSIDYPVHYDLNVAIEVLEHLTAEDGKKAIQNLCKLSNRVLFSSTPDDHEEPTHQNVQPLKYWIKLFEDNGFVQDKSYDTSWLTAWAMLFCRANGSHADPKKE